MYTLGTVGRQKYEIEILNCFQLVSVFSHSVSDTKITVSFKIIKTPKDRYDRIFLERHSVAIRSLDFKVHFDSASRDRPTSNTLALAFCHFY